MDELFLMNNEDSKKTDFVTGFVNYLYDQFNMSLLNKIMNNNKNRITILLLNGRVHKKIAFQWQEQFVVRINLTLYFYRKKATAYL